MDVRPIGQINTNIRLASTPQMRDLQQYEQLRAYRDSQASEPGAFLRDPHPAAVRVLDEPYGPPLNFCYRPLYFEEVNLERYGHSWGGLQPAVSAARFYGNFALLPYKLAANRPGFCTFHQHHARPGAAAPPERPVLSLCAGGALLQTAAIVGLIALIP